MNIKIVSLVRRIWQRAYLDIEEEHASWIMEYFNSEHKIKCPYCGDLDWTLKKYGTVLHKENCSYHQGNIPKIENA